MHQKLNPYYVSSSPSSSCANDKSAALFAGASPPCPSPGGAVRGSADLIPPPAAAPAAGLAPAGSAGLPPAAPPPAVAAVLIFFRNRNEPAAAEPDEPEAQEAVTESRPPTAHATARARPTNRVRRVVEATGPGSRGRGGTSKGAGQGAGIDAPHTRRQRGSLRRRRLLRRLGVAAAAIVQLCGAHVRLLRVCGRRAGQRRRHGSSEAGPSPPDT